MRFAACKQAVVLHIGNPVFWNSSLGIKLLFRAAVVLQRGVRDFNDQQNVRRCGIRRSVIIRLRPEQHDIRLRLVILVQAHRTLHPDDRQVAGDVHHRSSRAIHRCAVARTNRAHRENLSMNKFHAIPVRQNARLGHALILVNREQSLCDLRCHSTPSLSQTRGQY